MKIEQTIYEVVEAGQYVAKLIEVEEREGNWGNYLLFTFELQDADHVGVNVSGAASAKFSPKSKLYGWAKSLFGKAIPREYALDTADLIGRQCLLDLDIENTADGEFNRIAGVRPARREGRPATPPTQTHDDDVSWPSEPPAGLEDEGNEIPF